MGFGMGFTMPFGMGPGMGFRMGLSIGKIQIQKVQTNIKTRNNLNLSGETIVVHQNYEMIQKLSQDFCLTGIDRK